MRISYWSSDVCSSDLGDAIGKEPDEPLSLPDDASDDAVEKLVWQQLRTCFDPEIPINVVDLGLVYEANVTHGDDGKRLVEVKMTLTAPGCGMGEILVDDVRSKLEMIPTVRSEEHTSELQSLMRISYAVFCLKK